MIIDYILSVITYVIFITFSLLVVFTIFSAAHVLLNLLPVFKVLLFFT